ncbi:putative protein [Vanrija pseudolonga]|uniref:Purtative protein n=1 Tax=Vanrija pseudolonga TaxID=143232 RepID=A0AAF0Y8L4_9TREE|nr:purtative protein [Vanrija pseudolonga]
MSSPKILILGAAGYMGGDFLVELLKTHPAANITTLVRSEAQIPLLKPLGVNVYLGSVEADTVGPLAAAHDVVVNFAVPFGGGDAAISAIIESLEQRAATHTKPVLIHTVGTGTVLSGTDGEAPTGAKWSDDEPERWEALPDTAYFQSGTRLVVRAAERGLISAYVVTSPTVYGVGKGPGKKVSLQVPDYVAYAKENGQAAYIGKGENVWGNVHVSDLTSLYLAVLAHALQNPAKTAGTERGWSNLVYSGVGEHNWKDVVTAIGDALHAKGEVKAAGAISIPEGTGKGYMFGGSSVLAQSKKARALGWVPKAKGIVETVVADIEA